ncbi:hypothetical protein SAMN04488564_111323 [Lentzea waywayandensis]|uniref:DUF998 domain-containing protein n=1 Tax=Lentzea waywayandensis TaxID=84724 RepID=A0A1I6FDF9_9PSEU|nr:hypothetical protein [Lentzea waywayandensis]SFR27883.1 hypothetical protein SAMN04488564_111323 [Lentzea waywayandensis]
MMALPDNDNYRQTFFALRFATIMLVCLLALSIVAQVVIHVVATSLPCVQHSISAYYHTSAQMVFVGALCAIGVCLIIYRAKSNIENWVLDCSGFLAFMVAFMPTSVDPTCGAKDEIEKGAIFPVVANNVLSLSVTAAIALLLTWIKHRLREAQKVNRSTKQVIFMVALLLVAAVSPLLFWFDDFPEIGHGFSAALFFVGIFVVVVVNSCKFTRSPFRIGVVNKKYARIAGLMIVTAAILFASSIIFPHWLIILEGALIVEFALFWSSQTKELSGLVPIGTSDATK